MALQIELYIYSERERGRERERESEREMKVFVSTHVNTHLREAVHRTKQSASKIHCQLVIIIIIKSCRQLRFP